MWLRLSFAYMYSFFVLARGIHGMRKREEDAMNYGKGNWLLITLLARFFRVNRQFLLHLFLYQRLCEKREVQITDQSWSNIQAGRKTGLHHWCNIQPRALDRWYDWCKTVHSGKRSFQTRMSCNFGSRIHSAKGCDGSIENLRPFNVDLHNIKYDVDDAAIISNLKRYPVTEWYCRKSKSNLNYSSRKLLLARWSTAVSIAKRGTFVNSPSANWNGFVRFPYCPECGPKKSMRAHLFCWWKQRRWYSIDIIEHSIEKQGNQILICELTCITIVDSNVVNNIKDNKTVVSLESSSPLFATYPFLFTHLGVKSVEINFSSQSYQMDID
jgi:hypothetical protein